VLVLGNTLPVKTLRRPTDIFPHYEMLCGLAHLLAVFMFYFKRNVNKEDNIGSSGEQSSSATLLLSITAVHISTYRC